MNKKLRTHFISLIFGIIVFAWVPKERIPIIFEFIRLRGLGAAQISFIMFFPNGTPARAKLEIEMVGFQENIEPYGTDMRAIYRDASFGALAKTAIIAAGVAGNLVRTVSRVDSTVNNDAGAKKRRKEAEEAARREQQEEEERAAIDAANEKKLTPENLEAREEELDKEKQTLAGEEAALAEEKADLEEQKADDAAEIALREKELEDKLAEINEKSEKGEDVSEERAEYEEAKAELDAIKAAGKQTQKEKEDAIKAKEAALNEKKSALEDKEAGLKADKERLAEKEALKAEQKKKEEQLWEVCSSYHYGIICFAILAKDVKSSSYTGGGTAAGGSVSNENTPW